MANSEIFVGRKEELNEFTKALEGSRGQAIIVVGNRGMGKTWLVNRMAKLASEHPTLKCGFVRYEVTPNTSPDSTMTTMMDNAFEAGQVKEGSFDGTKRGLEQWRSFLNVFNLGDLVLSLRRDQAKDTKQQFLERLELISKTMPKNGRAIFIVDPEKEMAEKSDQDWAIVVKNLPEKIKLIFAQRTEDALVGSEVIDGLDNVVRIPDKILDTLSEEDVDELVNCRKANLPVSIPELQKALKRYNGHPYAIGAALDLVEQGTKLEELPKKPEPTKFAELQWKKVCEISVEAMKLLEAYAILEVAVPDDIVEYVSKLDATTRKTAAK
jgi:energy-coupling factor transporter ATP-binding protein EcfA2